MKKRVANEKKYGIAVDHPDGVVGWLTGLDSEVELYDTPEDAERALKKHLKDTRYTWTLPIEVRVYDQ